MKMFMLFCLCENLVLLPKMINAQESSTGAQPESLDGAKIIGTPRVKCNNKWLTLELQTNVPFQGRIYVNGRAFDRRCSAQFLLNQTPNASVQIPILDCANLEEISQNNRHFAKQKIVYLVWVDVRVDFHPIFVTKTSQVFRAECTEVSGLDQYEEDRRLGPANTLCSHELSSRSPGSTDSHDSKSDPGEADQSLKFTTGERVVHRWYCSDEYSPRLYAVLLRNCEAISRSKQVVQLIDQTGCTVDDQLMSNLHMINHSTSFADSRNAKEGYYLMGEAESNVFKFLEESELRFKCSLLLIPRSSANNAPVELPKCSVTKEELMIKATSNISDLFQFINPNKRFVDVIETITITDWLKVSEKLPITNFDKAFPISSTPSTNNGKLAENSIEGSIHKTAPISQIAFENGKDGEEDLEPRPRTHPSPGTNGPVFYQLRNSKVSKSVGESHKGTTNEAEHAANCSISTQHHEPKNAQEVHSGLKSNNPESPPICSWRALNTAILIWSIGSMIVWLLLITKKVCEHISERDGSLIRPSPMNLSPSSTTDNSASIAALSMIQPMNRHWIRQPHLMKTHHLPNNRSADGSLFRPTYGRFSSLRIE